MAPRRSPGRCRCDGCVVEVFATPAATEEHADLAASGARWTLVDERALASLSDSVTPAGLVAVCRFLDVPLDDVFPPAATPTRGRLRRRPRSRQRRHRGPHGGRGRRRRRRTGRQLGGRLPPADRAGQRRQPLPPPARDRARPARRCPRRPGSRSVVLAADADGEVDLYDADEQLARPTAWLFGNEAWGLPAELAAAADHRVRIPIHGRAESLNLATAAALCLYASARVHRR